MFWKKSEEPGRARALGSCRVLSFTRAETGTDVGDERQVGLAAHLDFVVARPSTAHSLSVRTDRAALMRAAQRRAILGALSDAAERLATARSLSSDGEVKKSGVTWGVPVAPGLQLGGGRPSDELGDAAAGDAAGGAAGEGRAGDASNAGARGSPPPLSPGEALTVIGVSALAVGGLAYLMHRSEQRDLQAFEQGRRERIAAFEETLARRQLERFIEDTVEAAAARHFEQLRGRVEAGERGRDLRARSHEQERDNKATEAERRRDGRAAERDRRAAEAERERDRRAGEAAAQRDRKSAASEASRAGAAASAWAQQQRELQQRADAQLAALDAKMQEFKDQMMALMRPPAPAPSSGAVPGGVTDRLRKLYDDD